MQLSKFKELALLHTDLLDKLSYHPVTGKFFLRYGYCVAPYNTQ